MEFDRKHIKESVAAIGFTVIITPFIIDANNARRVINSLVTGRVDCAEGTEPITSEYPFDAIVVPGAGSITSEKGYEIPSFSEEMRLTAAAFAYNKKLAPWIILLDGESTDGALHNRTREFLQNEYGQYINAATIPNEAILTEDASINTGTNMEELAKMAQKHKLNKVVLITNAYHQIRATLLACANGIAASHISAENLLAEQGNPEIQQQIKQMYNSPSMSMTLLKEKLEVLWLLWDTKGTLLTKLAQIKKNR